MTYVPLLVVPLTKRNRKKMFFFLMAGGGGTVGYSMR